MGNSKFNVSDASTLFFPDFLRAWVSAKFELARVWVIGSQLYMYWKVRIKFNDSSYSLHVGCATDETKLWLSPSAKQCRNPCSGSPPVYQDLSMRHDWPVKKAIVDFQTGWKEIQNAFLVIHWVRIWVCAMIGLWRKLLWICQTRWKEIQNAFLVIHWVRIWVCAMIGLWRKPLWIS